MNTVGIFAGRGDVILAMGMALLFGIWLGYQYRGWVDRLKLWCEARKKKSAQN